MNNKTYTSSTIQSQIEKIAETEVPYKLFAQSTKLFFESRDGIVASNTIWNGKASEHSLSFGLPILGKDSRAALPILRETFNIQSSAFDKKYDQAVRGDGQEWRRITTLHSSSLTALLCFYSVSEDKPLMFPTPHGIVRVTTAEFEVKNKIGNGHPSNMDIVLSGTYDDNSNKMVFILLECKFSEYLHLGQYSGIKNSVYGEIYSELCEAFDKMGLKTVEDKSDEGTFTLTSKSGICRHYTAGIKQMISHFMGANSFCNEHKKADVYLAELLFDFGQESSKWLNDYMTLYRQLSSALNLLEKPQNLDICPEVLTYQDLLRGFALDSKVKEFYNL